MDNRLEELNRINVERLAAKRACEAAEGTPEYRALLAKFRELDHKREELTEELRASKLKKPE